MTQEHDVTWLERAKRLQALASTGMHFGASDFDKERYEEIGVIAHQMLSDIANKPIRVIEDLIPDYAKGYATPQIDVRGAVFDGDQILLVHEKSDGLWTLPGGYADVGLSAAQNTEKEVLEEAGLTVKARLLFCVRHKAKHEYDQDVRDFYKFYFICESLTDDEPHSGPETHAAQFFPLDDLPPLSTGRVIAADIELAHQYLSDPQRPTSFD